LSISFNIYYTCIYPILICKQCDDYIFYAILLLTSWRIDNLFVGPSEITFGQTNGGKLRNAIMHQVIWDNQKTDYFVYRSVLVTHTCNAWRNKLSGICRSIKRHFKHSVDMLFVTSCYMILHLYCIHSTSSSISLYNWHLSQFVVVLYFMNSIAYTFVIYF